MPKLISIWLAVLTLALPAFAVPQVPEAGLRGQAEFRVLGVPIYEARLFTPNGQPLDWAGDYGLELTYLRPLTANALINSTQNELVRLGHVTPNDLALGACFQDVGVGDRYLAVPDGTDRITFWRNGERVCTLDHPGFAHGFMSIFLGDNTQSAAFTRALLGR